MGNLKDALDDLIITNAAVVDSNTFVFVATKYYEQEDMDAWLAKESETRPETFDRVISHNLKTQKWGWKQYTQGYTWAKPAGGLTSSGQRQALFVTSAGEVTSFQYENGPNQREEPCPARGIRKVKLLGDHFYAAGAGRGFMRRMGPGDWEVFSYTPYTDPASDPGAFAAMDGYGENDIFLWAARRPRMVDRNSLGSLHHWDGAKFTEIPLPKDIFEGVPWGPFGAIDICCAPDGQVFLSGANGELLMGSRDGFVVLLKQEERSWPRTNLAWFKDVLYGATQGGLFTFDFDQTRWVPAPFVEDENAPVNFPYIDANEDVMLLAGGFGASIYDGERWTRIAGDVSALDMTRLRLMERQVEDVRDLRDILRDEAQQQ